jgi:DUF4097 and DUF4098 domain-containing protein YvlB
MSKVKKAWIISALSLIIIFIGVMTLLKWDFKKITGEYATNEHAISESFGDISVVSTVADITFVPAEDGECRVVCRERKNLNHAVSVNEGVLTIEEVDTRKWYEHIGIGIGSSSVTVYLPASEYGRLTIKSSTSDVEIPKDFVFESIDVTLSTGHTVCSASAKELKIKTSTGNISVTDLSAGAIELSVSTGDIVLSEVSCEGALNISVSTGKTKADNVKCQDLYTTGNTGEISLCGVAVENKLSATRSTGDVKLDRCDAAEVYIKTDTGDVKGCFLSEKIVYAKTDTGKINVPKSTTGGLCEITTDTGNITVSFE